MRPVRKITPEEENFRIVKSAKFQTIRRDSVEPEPLGTIVLAAFEIIGYEPDCDGSLMARLKHIDRDGRPTGWEPSHLGLRSDTQLVLTREEWQAMFRSDETKQ